MTLTQYLNNAHPTCTFTIVDDNYESIVWDPSNYALPPEAVCMEGMAVMIANYAKLRVDAYPSLQDQADMQFHDLANNTTTWLDAIQAVKDAYPKPV